MNRLVIAATLALGCVVSGCAQNKDHVITIHTKYGDMVALLFDETPQHKKNFIKLAEEGFFDSLLFHRVIQGFMIQGGDPDSRRSKPGQKLGNGGPGYTVPAEIDSRFIHERGVLSAARLGNDINSSKASSGSQFYIVQGRVFTRDELVTDQEQLNKGLQQILIRPENQPLFDTLARLYQSGDMEGYMKKVLSLKSRIQAETGLELDKPIDPHRLEVYTTVGGAPHLDGEYTVFGKVIKGLEVIDWIAEQPTDQNDRPLENIYMKVTVELMSKKKIEKLYGYRYPENL
ncbi:MAG TPA: peptidylprolyl isomerase [Cyclobacteriaceae bacterium]|jgi:peptidyl-prolyl cis-trans isomerase B (cyclophilin B)|nr:peptidylprolyl isomerase [Cyclobacteriaceae bacterium]